MCDQNKYSRGETHVVQIVAITGYAMIDLESSLCLIVVVMRVINARDSYATYSQCLSIARTFIADCPSFGTFSFTRETRDPYECRTTSFTAIRWCSKDFPVLCSVRLSLWSRMDRPPANESQRSEQIVVLARTPTRDQLIQPFGCCHSHTLRTRTHGYNISLRHR